MKNRAIKIALGAFLILTSIDLISTLMLGDLVRYLEANPSYKYIGLVGILFLNLLAAGLVYLWYGKGSINSRFVALNLIISSNLVRILVVVNNFRIYLSHPTVEQAMAVTQASKNAAVSQAVILQLLPFLAGIISFFIFRLDHKIKKK